ncbi:hypothetical protein VTL71DRAFT_5475 [Oculimacula yallundae]|uniref:Aldehyde dehydrogenase domain-containing protein n=1 Tax=Oculimacula yallundae TaxID=86028 RepID=A0ABR4C1T2_9HELO
MSSEPPTYPLLINNKSHTTSTTFPVSSPSTGEILHHFSSASIADIDLALQSAQSSFPAWKRLPPPQKRDIFIRASDILTSRASELRETIMQETGAVASWSEVNINVTIDMLRNVAGQITSLQGSIPTTAHEGDSALILKEPYGVALAIAPWNAPYILGMRAMLFPLAAGNTVILKAPESSPRCSLHLVQALHDAGLPAGVLNFVAHRVEDAAEITRYLIESPVIKKINFTGSTHVGRIIAEIAGRNLKPVLLELGGKAPAIVCEDADLELAAKECAVGAFMHAGQICMSTERIIVFEKVLEEFQYEFKKAVAAFAPENGPKPVLINAAGVQKNKKLLDDAIGKGARVLTGDPKAGEGTSMMPVVVVGTKKDMDLYYTESFGPTVSVMVVQSEEEALELANDTEYGLSAAVFTQDLGKAFRIAKGIESGAVHINGMTVHDESALPHGGVKSSGYGRFGANGLEEWVRTKTITFKD